MPQLGKMRRGSSSEKEISMFAMSGLSGVTRGTTPQSCISGYISSGQLSPGWWEPMFRYGKAAIFPGLLAGIGVEISKFKVPPHLDPPGIVRPIDLGPLTLPIAVSGAIASGIGVGPVLQPLVRLENCSDIAPGKLGKGGGDVTNRPSKPFVGTLWVTNPTR
jgi:hypothetical protein